MAGELSSVREARERAIARLSDRFAHDDLDVEEFDARLTALHRAATVAELEALSADLGSTTAITAPAAPAGAQMVPAASVRERAGLFAVMGGVHRAGQWTCPRRLTVRAIMGGALLDFREARLAAGVTEVSVFAMMGGVQVVVPPGLAVEVDGSAVMGGFDHLDRSAPVPDPDRPVLRVTGLAIMGGVSLETRLPGEDEDDAHHRRRLQRREERRVARALESDKAPRALPAPDDPDVKP